MNANRIKKIAGVVLGLVVIYIIIVATLKHQSTNQNPPSPLPESLRLKLTKLSSDLAGREAVMQELSKDSKQTISDLATMARIVGARQQTHPGESGTELLMGLDGFKLYLAMLASEADLHYLALQIDEGVIAGILAGKSYEELDRELQVVEGSLDKRDASLKNTGASLAQVANVITLAEHGSGREDFTRELDLVSQGVILEKMHYNQVLAEWEEIIKPITKQLRELVDLQAKNGR